MTLRLRWFARPLASCLHAVAAIESQRAISDVDWQQALAEPARLWLEQLRACQIPIDRFLCESVAATIASQSPAEIVPRALASIGAEHLPSPFDAKQIAPIVDGLTALVDSMMNAFPNLERELVWRIGPLREHWEARGPGVLRGLQRSTHGRTLDDFTAVVMVHPLHDGDVQPLHRHRSVLVEGLLVNPEPRLPEIVRLAWGFSRLRGNAFRDSASDDSELGNFAPDAKACRQALVESFALLAAALATAEHVEICQAGAQMVELAMRVWHLPNIVTGDALWRWWQSYCEAAHDQSSHDQSSHGGSSRCESGKTWEAALAELDAQLPALAGS